MCARYGAVAGRPATRARPVRRDQKGLEPTESDTGCSWSRLSDGCDSGGHYCGTWHERIANR